MNKGNEKKWYHLFSRKLVFISVAILVLAVTTGFVSYESTKTDLTIVADGQTKEFSSHAENVRDALSDFGIHVTKHDLVSPGLDADLKSGMTIEWTPAHEITYTKNGQTVTEWSTARTVKQFLNDHHLSLTAHDRVSPSVDTLLKDTKTINVQKAFSVLLTEGKKKSKKVWTTSTTVVDLLKKQHIKVGKEDRVEPSLDADVTDGMKVNVISVKKTTDVVEERTPFKTVTHKDGSLEKGEKKVIHPGKKGKIAKKYKVTLENGKEVSRELKDTKTLKKSKDEVVAIGTKSSADVSGESTHSPTVSRGTKSEGRELLVTSTAYSESCAGCTGRTSTGIDLRANPNMKVIAVDPSVIPLGSKVYVEGYGYAIAGDTGGAIKGNRIDVFFSSESRCSDWGRRQVRVKIID
ncbi:hypothetical protein A374_16778 [Fictibacillus macauensis ZFHKF-1]|uniref:G5 domain-containing protein n=1 Tax=Fictibacillus macauensis ZFHKF-1 TaxID=1196324 RepID=I8AF02_9BACL|nr:G5 and 3D domain-containing protein [Fictibacillus macauensis]EIT84197.1 hypothetical protein A374_16778 [Fictibacillus macauensis ZFHKF-1]